MLGCGFDARTALVSPPQEHALATPNYSYEKRQRELAKKRKNEEKLQKKKQQGSSGGQAEQDAPASGEAAPGAPGHPAPGA